MTIESAIKEKNCHAPDDKLSKYMSEKAYILRREEELILRMETKRKLSKKEENELQYIKSRSATLKNTKREVLDDIIFPAMANITFFFDAISRYPELEPDFKVNIWDLLGVRRLNPKPNLVGGNYAFMFETLIACMLSIGINADDFRVRLVHILEDLIWKKVTGLRILETLSSSSRVLQEIGKPSAWTELLASRINDVYDFSILNHGIKDLEKFPYGGTEEERLKAFEKNVSERLPRRTFTYDTNKLMEWKNK